MQQGLVVQLNVELLISALPEAFPMQIFTALFLQEEIGLAIKSDQYLVSFQAYYHTAEKIFSVICN